MKKLFVMLAVLAIPVVAWSAPDTAAGQKTFAAQCAGCHSVQPGASGVGPSLKGVVGRPAAGLEGFKYTPALSKSGLTWDASTLDAFLGAPMQKVPGTSMFVAIPDATIRANVIAYLATLN